MTSTLNFKTLFGVTVGLVDTAACTLCVSFVGGGFVFLNTSFTHLERIDRKLIFKKVLLRIVVSCYYI